MEDTFNNPQPPIEQPLPPTPPPTPQAPAQPAATSGTVLGMKLEFAQAALIGIMAASYIYSIYYYRTQLKNPAALALKKRLDTVERKLSTVLGPEYDAAA